MESGIADVERRVITVIGKYAQKGALVIVPETMRVTEENFSILKAYLTFIVSLSKQLPVQVIVPSPFSSILVTGNLPKPMREPDFIVSSRIEFKAGKDPKFSHKEYKFREYEEIEDVPDDELYYADFQCITQSMFVSPEVSTLLNSKVLTPALKGKNDLDATLHSDGTYQLSLLYEYQMITDLPADNVLSSARIPTRLFRILQNDGVLQGIPRDSRVPVVFKLPNADNIICTNLPL